MSGTEDRLRRRSDRVAGIVAIISIVCGGLVMLGWIFDISALRGPVPGQVTMKANTAFGFILAGTLLLVAGADTMRASRWLRVGLESVILLMSMATLSQYLSGIDLRIDQVFSFAPIESIRTTSPDAWRQRRRSASCCSRWL